LQEIIPGKCIKLLKETTNCSQLGGHLVECKPKKLLSVRPGLTQILLSVHPGLKEIITPASYICGMVSMRSGYHSTVNNL